MPSVTTLSRPVTRRSRGTPSVVSRTRQVASTHAAAEPGRHTIAARLLRPAWLLLLGHRRDERLLGPRLGGEVDQPGAVARQLAVADERVGVDRGRELLDE